jgi:hypothetical protein
LYLGLAPKGCLPHALRQFVTEPSTSVSVAKDGMLNNIAIPKIMKPLILLILVIALSFITD